MTIQDTFNASSFIATIVDLVSTNGITLEIGSDFQVFENALLRQPDRHPIGPLFASKDNKLDESNGFWIIGKDTKAEIVHTQAMRIIELKKQTLASYLDARFLEFIPYKIDEEKSCYCSTPGARNISGMACYHGELWLKDGAEGYRGGGMTTLLARLALIIGLYRLSPDYIFGFMFSMAACKGLAAREGYMHTDPACIHWCLPGQDKMNETWMVWMNREDIRHLMNNSPVGLYNQFESKKISFQKQKAA